MRKYQLSFHLKFQFKNFQEAQIPIKQIAEVKGKRLWNEDFKNRVPVVR